MRTPLKKIVAFLFFLFHLAFTYSQNPLNERLLSAVKQNRFDSVKFLVEQGADVNYCDSNKATVVMWAALKGDLDMGKYLVGKGADDLCIAQRNTRG
jgi:ankyrin repeat protein